MNYIQHKPDLGRVVMPLVRVMALADLSWDDRAKFAEAIQECCRHWQSMEAERRMLEQNSGMAQQGAQKTYVENPAPDAAAPTVPSGICGNGFVTR